jgi:hypothetical protein
MLLGERAPADLRITLSVDGASLVVAIDGLPPDRVERRRHLLPTLVDGLEADGERVVIRAGS